MATKKAAVKKAPLKRVASFKQAAFKAPPVLKPITVDIKNPIYNIDSYGSNSAVIENSEGDEVFTFTCDVEDGPLCCGVKEIGSFDLDDENDQQYRKEKVAIVKELLRQLVARNTSGKSGKALYFTLIAGDAGCTIVRDAVADETLFTCVKVFKNTTGRDNWFYLNN